MNRLDWVPRRRAAHRRAPALSRILLLSIVLGLVLFVGTLTMVTLPPSTAEAAAHLGLFCEPGDPDYVEPKPDTTEPKPDTTEPKPTLARPRATTTGKDINGGDLLPGDEILWTVTVKNLGDKLTKIVITDVVPEWTTYVAGSIDGSGANDSGAPTLTWAVDSLRCGERVTVSFRSRVDDGVPGGTLITNKASADSAQTPPGVSDGATLKVADSATVSTTEASASSPTTTVTVVDLTAAEDAWHKLVQALMSWWSD